MARRGKKDELDYFTPLQDWAEFRPLGEVTLQQAADLVTKAIEHARAHKQARLLVDISRLTGFPSPGVGQRYFIVSGWAAAALGEVRLAVVARQEIIDPQRFGVAVAKNAGMAANIFTTEAEALVWLMGDSWNQSQT